MCAIMNGIAYDGIFRPSGATFLVFADYCRAVDPPRGAQPPRRSIYIFTHDSVGVGEDGPTHEPVETIPGLRVIPNLDVIRPADPEETAGAFVAALERTERSDAPRAHAPGACRSSTRSPCKTRREGVLKGGYIAKKETGAARAHPPRRRQRAAARDRRPPRRSAPARASSASRASRASIASRRPTARRCCPSSCRRRVAIEARCRRPGRATSASTASTLGIDRFGISAPGRHRDEGARHHRRARRRGREVARRRPERRVVSPFRPRRDRSPSRSSRGSRG